MQPKLVLKTVRTKYKQFGVKVKSTDYKFQQNKAVSKINYRQITRSFKTLNTTLEISNLVIYTHITVFQNSL